VLLGELAGLGNAATWAITSLILGGLAGRHSALRVNTIRLCAGALYFLCVIPLAGCRALFAGLSLAHALALGGTSVLAQAIGNSLSPTSSFKNKFTPPKSSQGKWTRSRGGIRITRHSRLDRLGVMRCTQAAPECGAAARSSSPLD
jgi:hypothetical protein